MVIPTEVTYNKEDYKLLLEDIAKKNKALEEALINEKGKSKIIQNLVGSLNHSIKFEKYFDPNFFIDNICEFSFFPGDNTSSDTRIIGRIIPVKKFRE